MRLAARLRWPRSLAGRTALVLVVSLVLAQGLGLTIHALDRLEVIHHAQMRMVAVRATGLYRVFVLATPQEQVALLKEFDGRDDIDAVLSAAPPDAAPPPDDDELGRFRRYMQLVPIPASERPKQDLWYGSVKTGLVVTGLQMPDGRWLAIRIKTVIPVQWMSESFLIAFGLMTAVAVGLTLWAVRRLVTPVATLAAAAELLGRDVNAPPLREDGPSEVAMAAAAFNLMSQRIRRLLSDRNLMMAAISHDLRTPITRLRLRAEFVDDDEQRTKMLADLEELEAMVSASLAVGRDTAEDEPVGAVDLVALVRTVLDETADARPEAASHLSYDGVDRLTVRARPFALKRALTNLVTNAVKYGGCAKVTLQKPAGRQIALMVDDDGPGIPVSELDRLFQPFQRLEASRNRETGGVGLGLTIARNILRAHGGEVMLSNREAGGTRALVTLPA